MGGPGVQWVGCEVEGGAKAWEVGGGVEDWGDCLDGGVGEVRGGGEVVVVSCDNVDGGRMKNEG